MRLNEFPDDIKDHLVPEASGTMFYRCLDCKEEFGIDRLLYTCPSCGGILMLHHRASAKADEKTGAQWRKIFDYRKMINLNPVKGIFRFYEFIAPVIPLKSIVYLGEANTPLVPANKKLEDLVGLPFYFKNEGLNPSLSFKDRGMACTLSFLNFLIKDKKIKNLLTICASTGDTSASGALYSSYLAGSVNSAVLLPEGKVTLQQLSQPLGSGAKVLELPGLFDDCMKVVEELSERYDVALLNSKNSWRILGQESYSYEIAQDFDYQMDNKVLVVPIGNAGNIAAIISGLLKFLKAGIITAVPKIIGVQSAHADPVYRYYLEVDPSRRRFKPVDVKSSVAQAAMIGNPVSMPRVIDLVKEYDDTAGKKSVYVVSVNEQEIMDCMITGNMHGHISCTQGGETLAGLKKALKEGLVSKDEIGVLDSTAHVLKFSNFQEMYLEDKFPPEFGVKPKNGLRNSPIRVYPKGIKNFPGPGKSLKPKDRRLFVDACASEIAELLGLKEKTK